MNVSANYNPAVVFMFLGFAILLGPDAGVNISHLFNEEYFSDVGWIILKGGRAIYVGIGMKSCVTAMNHFRPSYEKFLLLICHTLH